MKTLRRPLPAALVLLVAPVDKRFSILMIAVGNSKSLALLSFYHVTEVEIPEVTYAYPGFGWVGDIGDQLMVNDASTDDSVKEMVSDYDEIYISVSVEYHRHTAERIFRKDHRVLCGGPASRGWIGANKPCLGAIENLLKLSEQNYKSAKYSIEWVEQLPSRIRFGVGVSAGTGCVWSKCTFCSSHGRLRMRDNWETAMMAALGTGRFSEVHPCVAGPDPELIRRYISILPNVRSADARLPVFARVPEIVEALKPSDDLSGMAFEIGMEALSDAGLSPMKKGISIEKTLELTDLVLSQGGEVHLMIMSQNPLEDLKQAHETLDVLEGVLNHHKGHTSLVVGDPTYWPTRETAKRAGGVPTKVPVQIGNSYNNNWWSIWQTKETMALLERTREVARLNPRGIFNEPKSRD